jgi:hypothetical protein
MIAAAACLTLATVGVVHLALSVLRFFGRLGRAIGRSAPRVARDPQPARARRRVVASVTATTPTLPTAIDTPTLTPEQQDAVVVLTKLGEHKGRAEDVLRHVVGRPDVQTVEQWVELYYQLRP